MYWNIPTSASDHTQQWLTLTWDVLKFVNLMPHIITGQD